MSTRARQPMSDSLRATVTTAGFVVVSLLLMFGADAVMGSAHGATATTATAPAGVSWSGGKVWKPCEYEDSRGCVWDARHMGNGYGRSFIARNSGTIVYIGHKRAHRLLFGADGAA